MTHIAIYGNTGIKRGWCSDCRRESFVIDAKLQCCGAIFSAAASKYKLVVQPDRSRRLPPAALRQEILAAQLNKCLYCQLEFGSTIHKSSKPTPIILRVCWDHLVPHSYSMNQEYVNFAAACQLCNSFKYSKLFDNLQEARDYIARRWQRGGYAEKNYNA